MSGTSNFMEHSELEDRLAMVLDRSTECDALGALIFALSPPEQAGTPLQNAAIGIDANVFLRINKHSKGADIIDYLNGPHSGPLILPGQVIQEFWNNQLQAVDTISAGIQKRFDNVKVDLGRIHGLHGKEMKDLVDQVERVLKSYNVENGHVYDEGTTRKTIEFLQLLKKKASVPFAPRARFQKMASHRKNTRTPPGFKDDGDGDFFVWVDFLTGLQQAQNRENKFTQVIFLSNEQKPDWTRAGMAHPILIAEVKALIGLPFHIWDLDRFVKELSTVT